MVASLNFKEIRLFEPFSIKGNFEITPIPVVHGEDCVCNGFTFGKTQGVLYLSDLSRIPKKTADYIDDWSSGIVARGGEFSLLVLDCLFFSRGVTHNTHFCLDDVENMLKNMKRKPEKVLLVGMAFKVRFSKH